MKKERKFEIMQEKFKGIFPALPTPFDSDDTFCPSSLSALIERNLSAGVQGFYVGGSTAEAFLLTDRERLAVYQTAAESAGGRATLIAHVGAISTRQAVEYGKYAASLGYDAISAVAPFYYKFSFDQIRRHYFTIQEAVGLPMIIYNIPAFSGVTLGVTEISEFLSHPEFIGIKHTSSDYFALQRFKAAFPDKVIYNGYDEMLLCGLAMGADGGIGSTYNFMADRYLRIVEKYRAGDHTGALAEQETANRIISLLIKIGVIEGVKEVLSQLGIPFGQARSPFSPIDEEGKKMIREQILPLLD